MSKKICVYCGKEFMPSHGNKKLCSDECKREYAKMWPSRLAVLKHFDQMICPYCGVVFVPAYPNQKCCCMKHGDMLYKAKKGNQLKREKRASEKVDKGPFNCLYCGIEFIPKPHTRFPKFCCKPHRRAYQRGFRRAFDNRTITSQYAREYIFERDQFICHICGEELNMTARYPAWDYPTIDHLIPLSKGGEDTVDNVKAAHSYCNIKKADRLMQ